VVVSDLPELIFQKWEKRVRERRNGWRAVRKGKEARGGKRGIK